MHLCYSTPLLNTSTALGGWDKVENPFEIERRVMRVDNVVACGSTAQERTRVQAKVNGLRR